ncbi:Nucleolar pre-ribosomal-associated protein 1 C-terminal domain-containing protein [Entamoeba marina]
MSITPSQQQILLDFSSSDINQRLTAFHNFRNYMKYWRKHLNDGQFLRYYLQRSSLCKEFVDVFCWEDLREHQKLIAESAKVLTDIFSLNNFEDTKMVTTNTIRMLVKDKLMAFIKNLSSIHFFIPFATVDLIECILGLGDDMYSLFWQKFNIPDLVYKRLVRLRQHNYTRDFRNCLMRLLERLAEGCNSKTAVHHLHEFLQNPILITAFAKRIRFDPEERQDRFYKVLIKIATSPFLQYIQISYFFKRGLLVRLYKLFNKEVPNPHLVKLFNILCVEPRVLIPKNPSTSPAPYRTLLVLMEKFVISHKPSKTLLLGILHQSPPIVSYMYLRQHSFGTTEVGLNLKTLTFSSFHLSLLSTVPIPDTILTPTSAYAQSVKTDPNLLERLLLDIPDIQSIMFAMKTSSLAYSKGYACLAILAKHAPSFLNAQNVSIQSLIIEGIKSDTPLIVYNALLLAIHSNKKQVFWFGKKKDKKCLNTLNVLVNRWIALRPILPEINERYDELIQTIIFNESPFESMLFRSITDAQNSSALLKIATEIKLMVILDFFIPKYKEHLYKNVKLPKEVQTIHNQLLHNSVGWKKIHLLLACFTMRKGSKLKFSKHVISYATEFLRSDLTINSLNVLDVLESCITNEFNSLRVEKNSFDNDLIDSIIIHITHLLNFNTPYANNRLYSQLISLLVKFLSTLINKKKISEQTAHTIEMALIPLFQPFIEFSTPCLEVTKLFLQVQSYNKKPSMILMDTLPNTSMDFVQQTILPNPLFTDYLMKMEVNEKVVSVFNSIVSLLPLTQQTINAMIANPFFMKQLQNTLLQTDDYQALFDWYWTGIWGPEKFHFFKFIKYLTKNKTNFIQRMVLHSCTIKRKAKFEEISNDMLVPINLLIYQYGNPSPTITNFVITKYDVVNDKTISTFLLQSLRTCIKSKNSNIIDMCLDQICLISQVNNQKFIPEDILLELTPVLNHLSPTSINYIYSYIYPLFETIEPYQLRTYTLHPLITEFVVMDPSLFAFGAKSYFHAFFDSLSERNANVFSLEFNNSLKMCMALSSIYTFTSLSPMNQWCEVIYDTITTVRYGYPIASLLLNVSQTQSVIETVHSMIEERNPTYNWQQPISHDFVCLLVRLYSVIDTAVPSFQLMQMVYKSYNGTMHHSDRLLFSFMLQYSSLYPKLPLVAGDHSFNYKQSIQLFFNKNIFFNEQNMQTTLSNFPFHRKFDETMFDQLFLLKSNFTFTAYDPAYLLPLIYHITSRCIAYKGYTFNAKEFVGNGFLSYVILSLSLEDESLRKIAYSILYKLIHLLSKVITFEQFQHKLFVMAFIMLLQNSITVENQQLPPITMTLYSRLLLNITSRHNALWSSIINYLFKHSSPTLPLQPYSYMNKLPLYPVTATCLFLDALNDAAHKWPVMPRSVKSKNVLSTLLAEASHPHSSKQEILTVLSKMTSLINQWCCEDDVLFYILQSLRCSHSSRIVGSCVLLIKVMLSFTRFRERNDTQVTLLSILIELLRQILNIKSLQTNSLLQQLSNIFKLLDISFDETPTFFVGCCQNQLDEFIKLYCLFEQLLPEQKHWFITQD